MGNRSPAPTSLSALASRAEGRLAELLDGEIARWRQVDPSLAEYRLVCKSLCNCLLRYRIGVWRNPIRLINSFWTIQPGLRDFVITLTGAMSQLSRLITLTTKETRTGAEST